METQASKLDIPAALRIAARYAPLVLLCAVLAAGGAFVTSIVQRKQYTATAEVLFRSEQLDQQAAGLPVVNSSDPQGESDTNVKLATLPEVAAETARHMGSAFTEQVVANHVSVSQIADTKLASVSATWTSPNTAAALANSYATQIVATRQRADGAYYASALRSVRLQLKTLDAAQLSSTQGAALKAREASLETLAQLQSADVQVQQSATAPTGPSAPKVTRNVVLGFILGMLAGTGWAFLLHRFDRRLREPSELEEIFAVPLIGVIPQSSALSRTGGDGCTRKRLPHREAEVFGLLRAHIRYFNVDRELRLLVVVSAAPGEGKTTVACNLALTSAMAGARVLLVEADLRRPTVAQQFAVRRRPGLAEVLLGTATLASSIQHAEFDNQDGSSSTVDVLVAGGMLPPNPAQVIESSSMNALLQVARREYDLVVVDTPPLVLVPDAFPLLNQADGVLVVSRLSHIRKDIASRLRDSLSGADAPVVGVVANGVGRTHQNSYGYDADYAAGAVDEPEASPLAEPDEASDHQPEEASDHQPEEAADHQPQAPRVTDPELSTVGVPEAPRVGVPEAPRVGVPAVPPLAVAPGMNGHAAAQQHPHANGVDRRQIPSPVRANGHTLVEERADVPMNIASPATAPAGGAANGHAAGADVDNGTRGSIPPPGWFNPEQTESAGSDTGAGGGSRGLARVLGRQARAPRVNGRS